MAVDIRGFWGTRQESVEELAKRWVAFLRRLSELDGEVFDGWRESSDNELTAPYLTPTISTLATYICAQNPEENADFIGRTATLSASRPACPNVRVSATAGGVEGVVGSRVVVTLGIEAVPQTAESEVARRLRGRLGDLLSALVEEWEPDWGDVSDMALRDAVANAQGLRPSNPRCGTITYLSAGRRALAPPDLPSVSRTLPDGGVVIDLTDAQGGVATVDQVIAVDSLLRKAGALEKLPIPTDRARW